MPDLDDEYKEDVFCDMGIIPGLNRLIRAGTTFLTTRTDFSQELRSSRMTIHK